MTRILIFFVNSLLCPQPSHISQLFDFAVEEQVSILAEDSNVLVSRILKSKCEHQKKVSDMAGNKEAMLGTSVALKITHVWANKLQVEVVNVNNLSPRENRALSRIQLYARLCNGTRELVEYSSVIKDVDRSIIFELQAQPVRFQFDLEQLSTDADIFVIVDLFHVNQALLKQFVGECVVKVNNVLF